MSKECSKLVAAYLAWLKAKITVREINGVCEITSPFVDRHNDRLQIYVKKKDDARYRTIIEKLGIRR